jgi:KUP system potassium uptake protein
VPLLLGALICGVMLIWQKGNAAVLRQADEMQISISDIVARIATSDTPRVPGTAVFLAGLTRDVPPIVVWYLRHIRSLHGSIVIVTVVTELVPYVATDDRVDVHEIAPRVWRARPFRLHGTAGYPSPAAASSGEGLSAGFLQRNLFPRARADRAPRGWQGLPRLVQSTFAFLLHNSSEAVEYFRLPRDMVVEMGRQFAI